jgi:transglutaminase-like putative cysteine protease
VISLGIHHRTSYRYRQAVAFGPHRMMLRPRESRDLRLIDFELTISPEASVTWAYDVWGNAVATAAFRAMGDLMQVDSFARIELDAVAWPIFDIAASAIVYPFQYAPDDWLDLGVLTVPQYPDPDGRLRTWTAAFVGGATTDTLALLKDLSAGVHDAIFYRSREAEGTQSPIQTLDLGSGSCRDFAELFADATRSLGFGARVVSGYLVPGPDAVGFGGAGSTHAWAEVYVPGAGWITFDPTNRSVGGMNLIPVAVARDIRQIVPITGSFHGVGGALLGMEVEVVVETQPVHSVDLQPVLQLVEG